MPRGMEENRKGSELHSTRIRESNGLPEAPRAEVPTFDLANAANDPVASTAAGLVAEMLLVTCCQKSSGQAGIADSHGAATSSASETAAALIALPVFVIGSPCLRFEHLHLIRE